MRTAVMITTAVSLATVAGCSNVNLVKARPNCQRGVGIFAWDICENVKDPVPTARLKIKGDENLNKVEIASSPKEAAAPVWTNALEDEETETNAWLNTLDENETTEPAWESASDEKEIGAPVWESGLKETADDPVGR